MKKILFVVTLSFLFFSCQKEETRVPTVDNEVLISDIDVALLNTEAKRFYENMGRFISLTTLELKNTPMGRLQSSGSGDFDGVLNPIVEEFANLDIRDENNTSISFFDLSPDEREIFIELWTIQGAAEMSPKLLDEEIGQELEEYVKTQNDAFDEVMNTLGNSSENGKMDVVKMSTNELYEQISANVQQRIKEKSEAYAKKLLESNPGLSERIKGSRGPEDHPDFVDPTSVLTQLRRHANRGNILINLPGSVWLSAHLSYYSPLAITNYVGIGKYPPGHVSMVMQSKTNLPTDVTARGVTISAQNGAGVILENVNRHWNCKASLCVVKKNVWQWRGFKSGFVIVFPNADNVIAYAESQLRKPYCSGTDFITAKSRTTCFICTTITWRSFNREGFNIHRLEARWMPTIAPADVLLSDNVVVMHKIK